MNVAVLLAICTALSTGRFDSPDEDLPTLAVGIEVQGRIDGDSGTTNTRLLTSLTRVPVVANRYRLRVDNPGRHVIELTSLDFDGYLVLRRGDGTVLSEDDDSLYFLHARLVAEQLQPGQEYILEACALHGLRGDYSLRLSTNSVPALAPSIAAERAITDAREVARRLGSHAAPTELTANALISLGFFFKDQALYDEARPLHERALAIRGDLLGPEHASTIAAIEGLARLLECSGRPEAARPLHGRALAARAQNSSAEKDPSAENVQIARYLSRLHAEPEQAVTTICDVRNATAAVRRSFVDNAIPFVTPSLVRSAMEKLAEFDDPAAARWQLELFCYLPPLHEIRQQGPECLINWIPSKRVSTLFGSVFRAYRADVSKRTKELERQGRKKAPAPVDPDILLTLFSMMRQHSLKVSQEKALWKFIERGPGPMSVRNAAVLALAGSKSKKTFARLLRLYANPPAGAQTRRSVLQVFTSAMSRATATRTSRKLAARVLPDLFETCREDTDSRSEYREMCRLSVAEATPLGVARLDFESRFADAPWKRLLAIRYLAETGEDSDAAKYLEAFRVRAQRQKEGRDARLRAHVELAIGIDPDRAFELLAEYAVGESVSFRQSAASLLSRTRSLRRLQVLGQLIEDPVPQISSVALWSLYRCGEMAGIEEMFTRLDYLERRGGLPLQDALEIFALATGEPGMNVEGWRRWRAEQSGPLFGLYQFRCGRGSTRVGSFFDQRIHSSHVGFVVDISGSMSYRKDGIESRLVTVYRELAAALRSLGSCRRFSLIVFSSGAGKFRPGAVHATRANVEAALSFFRAHTPGRSTNYQAALGMALAMPDLDTLYFLSDGAPTLVGLRTQKRLLHWFAKRNVTRCLQVNTVGFDIAVAILEKLAAQSGGRYRSVGKDR